MFYFNPKAHVLSVQKRHNMRLFINFVPLPAKIPHVNAAAKVHNFI